MGDFAEPPVRAFMLPYLARIDGTADFGDFSGQGARKLGASGMILRSALALGLLAAGLSGAAQAQGYPPYGQNSGSYQPPYRPLPGASVPDDDDDDIPASQRAAPGNYPPPPGGYRGPFGQQVDRSQLPPPGYDAPPAYGPPPAVVYGAPNDGRYPQPAPPYGRPAGNGQPESYGAARQVPQPYPPQGYQQPYQQGAPQQGYPQQPQQYGAAPADPGSPVQLGPVVRPQQEMTGSVRPNTVATLPPEDQPEDGKAELPPQFKRQLVTFQTSEPAGTLVIDTANTFLYLVLGNGQAMRYGIGVGREGLTWAGAERVSRMAEWPDWHPPAEMIERQPYLPRFMAGGEGNPLGARALYLGKTLYRIHGTNQPSTIGKYVSSGCIRLTNEDVQDLYSRVQVGTRVVVLPGKAPAQPAQASNTTAPGQAPVQQR
jgi:lipoprotein-anchoring transpeptidase ErfK/SrfK